MLPQIQATSYQDPSCSVIWKSNLLYMFLHKCVGVHQTVQVGMYFIYIFDSVQSHTKQLIFNSFRSFQTHENSVCSFVHCRSTRRGIWSRSPLSADKILYQTFNKNKTKFHQQPLKRKWAGPDRLKARMVTAIKSSEVVKLFSYSTQLSTEFLLLKTTKIRFLL